MNTLNILNNKYSHLFGISGVKQKDKWNWTEPGQKCI